MQLHIIVRIFKYMLIYKRARFDHFMIIAFYVIKKEEN